MGRAKIQCHGKNTNGSYCSNYALKGSYYCGRHQHQVTNVDIDNYKKNENIGRVVVLIIFVVIMIISFAAGCEKEFFKWAGH